MSKVVKEAKKVFVRLIVPAGKATPGPPVGPALGANGVKAIDFCKEFNARTAHLKSGVPMNCKIYIEADRSYRFDIRTPSVTYFLKKAAGIELGSADQKKKIGVVSLKHVYEIARIKQTDDHLKHIKLESICRLILGSAKSMGVDVIP